ncbi:MAG: glycosyltransferase family 2 protein [Phycisphaerae bacterium]
MSPPLSQVGTDTVPSTLASLARERWPMVSVIAPMYNEERFLSQFVGAMVAQDYPRDRFEVLLVDGQSEDGTVELAQRMVREHANFRLLTNPDRSLPHGSNIGIRNARGEIVARADVHAGYPPDYLRCCVDALLQHDAWCVGGVLRTEPGAPTAVARAIAIVQSHPFGTGNSYARIGTDLRVVDSVGYPCMRRSVFERVGLYNEQMPRHEDVELYSRIRRAGGKLMVVPSIRATYYARSTMRGLLRQAWHNGHETLMAWLTDRSCTRIRHWIPGAFVCSLVVLGTAAPWSGWALALLLAEAGAYLLALSAATVDVGMRYGWRMAPVVAGMCALHHLAYGLGTCAGLLVLPSVYARVKGYRYPLLTPGAAGSQPQESG